MKQFKVTLSRGYIVKIEAEDEISAMECSEFFIGDSQDRSNDKDRLKFKFEIKDIKLTFNEAIEVEENNE